MQQTKAFRNVISDRCEDIQEFYLSNHGIDVMYRIHKKEGKKKLSRQYHEVTQHNGQEYILGSGPSRSGGRGGKRSRARSREGPLNRNYSKFIETTVNLKTFRLTIA